MKTAVRRESAAAFPAGQFGDNAAMVMISLENREKQLGGELRNVKTARRKLAKLVTQSARLNWRIRDLLSIAARNLDIPE